MYGENKHYGTPRNPCVPDRVPGGSSSGSAVAVGAKLVDFALGEFFSWTIFMFIGLSSIN
jgi:Asp-tRNA(Asn)/Glu-tRNA(Gln) amidotransferase A subunit family amidase